MQLLTGLPAISPGAQALRPIAVCLDGIPCLLNPFGPAAQGSPLPKTPSDQDAMPQGGYPSNPNATGECKSGWYKPYTSGTFDDNYDQDGGLGQVTSKVNDGYPYPDGYPLNTDKAKR